MIWKKNILIKKLAVPHIKFIRLQIERHMTSSRGYDTTASIVAKSSKKVCFSPQTIIQRRIRTKLVSLVETNIPAELRPLFFSEPVQDINFCHLTGLNPLIGCRSLYPNFQAGPAWPAIDVETFFKTPQANSVRVFLDGVEYHSVTERVLNNNPRYTQLLGGLHQEFMRMRFGNGNKSLPPIESYKIDVSVLLDGSESTIYRSCARLNQDYNTLWVWDFFGFYPSLLSPEASEYRAMRVDVEMSNVANGLSTPPLGINFPNIQYDEIIYSNLGMIFPSFSILSRFLCFTIAVYRYISWEVYKLTLCFSFFYSYLFIVIRYYFFKYFKSKKIIKKYIFYLRLKILYVFYKIFK